MTIQLTNPNILDLTEWQKVINEVNSISARIDAITTSQGALVTTAVDWNSTPTFSQQFNGGTQKILFGKEKATFGDSSNVLQVLDFYEGAVVFSETSGISGFKAKPIVTATLASSSSVMPLSNPDAVVVIFNITNTGFGYRLINAGSHDPFTNNSIIYINWIAIGPQG